MSFQIPVCLLLILQEIFPSNSKSDGCHLGSWSYVTMLVHVHKVGRKAFGDFADDFTAAISRNIGSRIDVCLFVLRFYGPVNPMGSCRARSVYLTTRLLGRLSPLSG